MGPKVEITWHDCRVANFMKKSLILLGAICLSLSLKIFHTHLIAFLGSFGYLALVMFLVAGITNYKALKSGRWNSQSVPKGMMAGLLIGGILASSSIYNDYDIILVIVGALSVFGLLFAWSYHFETYQRAKKDKLDTILSSIIPNRMVHLLGTELRIIAMSLFIWSREKGDRDSRFYSSNNLGPILFTFAFFSFVEWFAIHMAIREAFPTVALVSSTIHLFFVTYLFGLAKSLYLRPTLISDNRIELRLGLMQSETISLDEIQAVFLGRLIGPARDQGLDIVLMSNSNIVIELINKRKIRGLFGSSKYAMFIGFQLDDPLKFVESIRAKIGEARALNLDNTALNERNAPADMKVKPFAS